VAEGSDTGERLAGPLDPHATRDGEAVPHLELVGPLPPLLVRTVQTDASATGVRQKWLARSSRSPSAPSETTRTSPSLTRSPSGRSCTGSRTCSSLTRASARTRLPSASHTSVSGWTHFTVGMWSTLAPTNIFGISIPSGKMRFSFSSGLSKRWTVHSTSGSGMNGRP
jgi:hypothetical protein